MGGGLTVLVSSVGGCAVVRLAGESDFGSVGRWRDVLVGLVEAGPSRVVVDVSRLAFMGVAGARVLVEMQEAMVARGGALAVAGARGEVARVLELTGAGQRVPVYRSVGEAVAGRVRFRFLCAGGAGWFSAWRRVGGCGVEGITGVFGCVYGNPGAGLASGYGCW